MKAGWQTKTIGELCEVVNGGTPKTDVKEFWDGVNLWITPAEMGKLTSPYVCKTARQITDKGIGNSSAKLMPLMSIILSSRAPIGHLVINIEPMAFNQGCKGLIPNKSLHYKYLYYYLFSKVDLLNSLGTGTTFKELSGGKLKEVMIPLAPLSEQQCIVTILEEALEDIATATSNAKKNFANARELFDSYLQFIFTSKGQGWVNKALGNVIKLEYGKPLDQADRVSNGLYPVYGANGEKCRTSKFYYDKKSIIVGRKGSAGEINLSEEKFWPLDVTYFVTYDNEQNDLMFLYYLLGSLKLPLLAKGVKPGINRNEVYALTAHFPDLVTQKTTVAKLDQLSTETKRLEAIYQQKLMVLEELKKSILNQAFSGQLN